MRRRVGSLFGEASWRWSTSTRRSSHCGGTSRTGTGGWGGGLTMPRGGGGVGGIGVLFRMGSTGLDGCYFICQGYLFVQKVTSGWGPQHPSQKQGFLEPGVHRCFVWPACGIIKTGYCKNDHQGLKSLFGRNRRQNDEKAIILRLHNLLKRIPPTAGCMALFRPSSSTIRSWALAVTTNVTIPPSQKKTTPLRPHRASLRGPKGPDGLSLFLVSRTSQKVLRCVFFCGAALFAPSSRATKNSSH